MCGVRDEAQIGFVIFIQRSRNTNNDRVHLRQLGIVGGRRKPFLSPPGSPLARCVDVGPALGERLNLTRIDVKTSHAKFLLAVKQRQRQSDISQSDNADTGFALLNFVLELIDEQVCGRDRS